MGEVVAFPFMKEETRDMYFHAPTWFKTAVTNALAVPMDQLDTMIEDAVARPELHELYRAVRQHRLQMQTEALTLSKEDRLARRAMRLQGFDPDKYSSLNDALYSVMGKKRKAGEDGNNS